MTKERPILMCGEMVKATRRGDKTQTRRVVTPEPWFTPLACPSPVDGRVSFYDSPDLNPKNPLRCPYGQPGDRLWVRETWRTYKCLDYLKPSGIRAGAGVGYLAGGTNCGGEVLHGGGKWRPSIFMPRWACRLVLEITAVRCERLRDISEGDAKAEGILAFRYAVPPEPKGQVVTAYNTRDWYPTSAPTAVMAYRNLWNTINAANGKRWEDNPWVWMIEFKEVGK